MSIGVIVNGVTYTFDNATYGYVTATDGFGMPPIERFSERGAQQHGDSDLGYRLAARRVSLVIGLPVENEAAFFAARARVLRLFHPDNAISLKVTDGGTLDRRLDVVYESSLAMPMDKNWKMQSLAINLKTSGLPAWYDASARSAVFDVAASAGALVVPMTVPHAVGASVLSGTGVLQYAGTWEEYPRIKIIGPISNCVITNTETGEVLNFTGYDLPAGHYLEIDTRYGYKTVLYDGVTNYIDKLVTGSDLATFHLAPVELEETVHENTFTVTGTNGNTLTSVEIYYNDRYIGV